VLATRLRVADPRGAEVTIFLVSAYAPVSCAPQDEREQYAEDLQRCISTCGRDDILVISMDANASPGVRSRHDDAHVPGRDQVRGPYGMPHENGAGKELCTLLGLNELCLPATYFKKKHYATWRSPCSKKWHQLDHFAVAQRDLKRVADAGRVGLPGKESDHFAVSLRLRVRARLKKRRVGPKRVRLDREALIDPDTKQAFQDRVKVELRKRAPHAAVQKVAHLEESMRVAAAATLPKVAKNQPGWYAAAAATIESAIAARNAAQATHHKRGTATTHQRLREARRRVKCAVRRARDAWHKKQMEIIRGFRSKDHINPKQAWQAISELRNGMSVTKPVPVKMFNAPDGTPPKGPAESAENMGNYIKEVFGKTGEWDPTVLDKVRQRDPAPFASMAEEPTDLEICDAVRRLANGKSAGEAECPAEFWKALIGDKETFAFLKSIIVNDFWKSGSYRPPPAEPAAEPAEPASAPPPPQPADPPPPHPAPAPAPAVPVRRSSRARELSHDALIAIANQPLPKQPTEKKVKKLDPAPEPAPVAELPAKDETADRDGVMYPEWLVSLMKLLPKKGNLAECKNWRGICLLDISSKIVSNIANARMRKVFASEGMEAQSGFTSRRGNRDGHFNVSVALQKRKEHGQETWALFIDLVKAFDTVVCEALFAIMRKFGLPDHFINILIRLHVGATIKVKIGDIEIEVPSNIGVRQGSCEGPSLFLFVIQAALETMDDWPADKPVFHTREDGEITGASAHRKRGITLFELWAALFADDCALLFTTREDMVKATEYLYHHLRRFGLLMHIGRGNTASKTEAMYFPPPRKPSDSGDQTNFAVADGFVSFTTEFRYLGSIIHQSLTSDADVDARITQGRAAFGALNTCFFSSRRASELDKGIVFNGLCLSILLYGSESWCLREDLAQRLRVFYNSCVRKMCRVTMRQVWRHHITTKSLLDRLGIVSFDEYYNSRLLRWAGHVARMPMTRTPRMLLTGWVPHKRPVGAPQMTIGRTINKALTKFGIKKEFGGEGGWRALAEDRNTWHLLTRTTNQPRN
jgi:hypothetical protein